MFMWSFGPFKVSAAAAALEAAKVKEAAAKEAAKTAAEESGLLLKEF